MRKAALMGLVATLLISGCATTEVFPKHDDPELNAMTREQRVEYLSQALVFASKNEQNNPGLPTTTLRLAVVPTFQAMLQQDGAYFATGLFALLLGNDLVEKRGNNVQWLPRVRALAAADPVIQQAYSSHPFPLPNFRYSVMIRERRENLADLQGDMDKALTALAMKGEPRACESLAYANPSPAIVSTCARVASTDQGNYAQTNELAGREQAAHDEARRRYAADRQTYVAQAQEVLRQCALVGVPAPAIDGQKAANLARAWISGSPERPPLSNRDNAASTEGYIQALEDALSARADASSFLNGSAVTPMLTPRMYMRLVKPECGIKGL